LAGAKAADGQAARGAQNARRERRRIPTNLYPLSPSQFESPRQQEPEDQKTQKVKGQEQREKMQLLTMIDGIRQK
jgi:hypothetical protein